jgi:hypothetical protein
MEQPMLENAKTNPKVPGTTDELRLLTKGTLDRVTIKDKSGNEHLLAPLDIADILEYEEKVGQSLLSGDLSQIRTRHIVFLLFLSLRKAGCSAADIDARKFKYTSETQVYRLFDLKVLNQSVALFVDIMRISGLELKLPEETSPADPQMAGQ